MYIKDKYTIVIIISQPLPAAATVTISEEFILIIAAVKSEKAY